MSRTKQQKEPIAQMILIEFLSNKIFFNNSVQKQQSGLSLFESGILGEGEKVGDSSEVEW